MNKYLGDYNIAKSSSSNISNIVWTKKNPPNTEKSKNKKNNLDKKCSSTNIIYGKKPRKKLSSKKIFKIYQEENTEKSKNYRTNLDKKFENSSADNCAIKQGFKRPGR